MKAQTTRGRLRQVEHWLRANYPTALPVRVRVAQLSRKVDPDSDGHDLEITSRRISRTSRKRDRFWVTLDPFCLQHPVVAIETLIHGWAHAFAWRPHLEDDPVFEVHHDFEWSGIYGRIYNSYFDEGGTVDSFEFSPRPWK